MAYESSLIQKIKITYSDKSHTGKTFDQSCTLKVFSSAPPPKVSGIKRRQKHNSCDV